MQRHIAALITLVVLILPTAAFADTQQSAIESRIQTLLVQISQITAQIKALTNATTTPTTVSDTAQQITNAVQQITNTTAISNATSTPTESSVLCPALDRSLSYGLSGNDVLSLQHFLNNIGVLDDDSLTGFFGVKTEAAVKAWQEEASVVSSGDAASTGWGVVGPKTRSAIEAACGNALAAPSTIGASLAISHTSDPLAASVKVTANLANTCIAQTYSLDWGDDSATVPISIPAGKCAAVVEDLTHQYAASGTYHISIASGKESTGADISIDSNESSAACVLPKFSFTEAPNGTVNAPYSLTLITDNGSSSLMLAATPLPAGLSLVEKQDMATTTGHMVNVWKLEGKPIIAASSDITISAHNDCGDAKVHFVLPVQ